jgi:hypothetical protein
MTPLFIAAVIAAPFVFRFVWRRTRLQANRERPANFPASDAPIADRINTATPEAVRLGDSLAFADKAEPPGKAEEEKPEEEQPSARHVFAPVQVQHELGTATQQFAEPNSCEENNGAKPIASGQTESNETIPSAHLNDRALLPSADPSLECETPPTGVETLVISDPKPPESAVIVPAAAALMSGDGTQARHTTQGTEVAQTAAQHPDEDGILANAGAEQAQSPQGTEESGDEVAEKMPQRYRPPPQRPPRLAPARPGNSVLERAISSDVELEIRIHAKFDRFGMCEVRLLPARKPEMDDEVEVRLGGIPLRLVAQDDWYDGLSLDNIGNRLRQGLELKGLLADHRRARWLLTGRDFYVLASHPRASGFVSTNRLVLGRSDVVLCVAGLLQEVDAILYEAGCRGYTKLGEANGVPSGWIALRGVTPAVALSLNPGIDQFYAIKAAPDIEIELEGGVWLHSSVWLAGFPPRIKLFGQAAGPVKLLIDNKEARCGEDGSFAVDGFDSPGKHTVYCEGLSRSCSYSIEEPPDSWPEWPAHHFGEAEICGPLVRLAPGAANRRVVTVPMSNPLLLGAEPGQIFRCSSRSVAKWKGFVPFDVVWALPAHPLISDKKTARILQFANAPLALLKTPAQPALGWSIAILDASRKGLRIENSSPESAVLWKQYKKAARNIWRAVR